MQKTLVILAAGMGSRYGGLKQIDTLGDNGESIIDFSIYDAIEAGFNKLVLIIRKEHEAAFENNLVKKIRPYIEVVYAYQALEDIPSGISIPEGREKPWGTTHALLACRNIIDGPFVICNADDYYGKDAFRQASKYLETIEEGKYAMVSYQIINTLSEHGTVTRGVCQKDDDNYLTSIKEVANIKLENGQALYQDGEEYKPLASDTVVSMNFWCFHQDVVKKMQAIFEKEIEGGIANNPLKYEALLPNHVGLLVKDKEASVKILTSADSWFGVTYREDRPFVVNKLKEYKEKGLYPHDLWQKSFTK